MTKEVRSELNLDEGALSHLMSFLDAPSLCAASMTCKSWNQLANDDYLWRPLHSKIARPMLNRSEVIQLPIQSTSSATKADCSPDGHEATEGCADATCPAQGQNKPLRFKDSYAIGHNWRRGRGQHVCVKFPGSSWNSAVRISPDCAHAVLASAGLGSVEVVETASGQPCPQYAGICTQHLEADTPGDRDSLDALFSSVAISPSCRQVAFGGFDGTVSLYDVARGSLIASATVPALQPAVTALGFCSIQSTQVIGAGLADGRVALCPLQAWQVCLGSPSCALHGGACNLLGCHGQAIGSREAHTDSAPRQVDAPWMTCNLGTGVEVRRIKGECGAGAGLSIVAGTSGGHVKVVDGAEGRVRSSLVGSCSCPVKCLSLHSSGEGIAIPDTPRTGGAMAMAGALGTRGGVGVGGVLGGPPAVQQQAPQALSRVVYAGFDHNMVGNGHYNAIYAWDVRSTERLALLHPGGSGSRSGRGGRGMCCRRQSGNDLNGMIRSVWADGWKVAVSAGKAVTVFETRTWKPLYEVSIPETGMEQISTGETELRAPLGGPQCSSSYGSRSVARPLFPTVGGEDSKPVQMSTEGSFPDGKGSKGEGSDLGCSSTELCMNVASPSPEKRRSFTEVCSPGERRKSLSDSVKLEQVSESPGSLIFYGNTMAVGLKNDSFALVTFGDTNSNGRDTGSQLRDFHVKRFD